MMPGRMRHDSVENTYLPLPHTDEIVEVPLLLTARQAGALENRAYARGLTTGEMLRQVLEEFLTRQHNGE